ncbi:MAG: hypothetical protein JO242_29400, partial [Streptosporangiaceae bacterium]|nr:hypothetical protein [Streptosporangiaceae bacterium]
MCARTVMMIDPQAAKRRKDEAAKDARVERFQEHAGTAALCGRDLPPDEVLASCAHIDALARGLRAAGMTATLRALRVRVYLDLLQGKDPRDRLTTTSQHSPAAGGNQSPAASGRDSRASGQDSPGAGSRGFPGTASGSTGYGGAGTASPDTGAASKGNPGTDGGTSEDDSEPAEDDRGTGDDDGGTGEDGSGGTRPQPPDPASPAAPGGRAAFPALINLLIPASTLLGCSGAPGEAAGWGLLDPATTQDLVTAASHHPATRWCITVTGPDGTATAHGCAPGHHPYDPQTYRPDPESPPPGGIPPPGGNRDGPAHPP